MNQYTKKTLRHWDKTKDTASNTYGDSFWTHISRMMKFRHNKIDEVIYYSVDYSTSKVTHRDGTEELVYSIQCEITGYSNNNPYVNTRSSTKTANNPDLDLTSPELKDRIRVDLEELIPDDSQLIDAVMATWDEDRPASILQLSNRKIGVVTELSDEDFPMLENVVVINFSKLGEGVSDFPVVIGKWCEENITDKAYIYGRCILFQSRTDAAKFKLSF